MTMNCASGAFNISTGTIGTTHTETLGWFPEIIVFQIVGNTASVDSGPDAGNIVRSIGMCMKTGSTTKRCCISGTDEDNVNPMNNCNGLRDDAIIGQLTPSGAWAGLLDIDLQSATTFRVIIDAVFSAGYRCHWWAFGGDDIQAIDLIQVVEPSTAGTVAVDAGFPCDALICLTQDRSGSAGTIGGSFGLSMGVAARRPSNGIEQGMIATSARDNVTPSTVAMYQRSDQIAGLIDYSTDTIKVRTKITGWTPSGFNLDFTEVSGSGTRIHFFLAVQGGRYSVKHFTTPADTVTNMDVTGALFTPVGGLYVSNVSPDCADDTISVARFSRFNVGMLGSDLTQGVQGFRGAHTQNPMTCRTAIQHDEVILNMSSTAINIACHATSFLSDGIRHINSVAGVHEGNVLMIGAGESFLGSNSDDKIYRRMSNRMINRMYQQ